MNESILGLLFVVVFVVPIFIGFTVVLILLIVRRVKKSREETFEQRNN